MQRFSPSLQVFGRAVARNCSRTLQKPVYFCCQKVNIHSLRNCNMEYGFPHMFSEDKLERQKILQIKWNPNLKNISRSFATATILFLRKSTIEYSEQEHNILRSLPAYKATTINAKLGSVNYVDIFSLLTYQDKNWSSVNNDELINIFLNVSRASFVFHSANDQQFTNLFNCLVDRIPSISDNQLLSILSALSYWPQSFYRSSANFDVIWKTLDKCCIERFCRWDISKIFIIADHWYALKCNKISMYFIRLIKELGAEAPKLSPTQFVQLMFYASITGELMMKNNMLRFMIKRTLNSISIEELAIIINALYNTETDLTNRNLIAAIIEYTTVNLDVISDHSLLLIIRFLASYWNETQEQVKCKFLEALHTHLNRFNISVQLEIAIFGKNSKDFFENITYKVFQRVEKAISSLTVKDIDRLTYLIMHCQHMPTNHSNILNMIVSEIRKPERIVEINQFPRSFVSCINSLVTMGVLPHDLISATLQPNIIRTFRVHEIDHEFPSNSDTMGRLLNKIDWSVRIELPPTYLGYRLPPETSDMLTKRFMGYVPDRSCNGLSSDQKFFLDIQTKLTALVGGSRYIEAAFILPHFINPDLIFCTTCDGEPLELPENFKNVPTSESKSIIKSDQKDLLWNVVICAGKKLLVQQTREPGPEVRMKKRQLTKLGYKVSIVTSKCYVSAGIKGKLNYLEQCLRDSSLNLKGRKEMALLALRETMQLSQPNITMDAGPEKPCMVEEEKEQSVLLNR